MSVHGRVNLAAVIEDINDDPHRERSFYDDSEMIEYKSTYG